MKEYEFVVDAGVMTYFVKAESEEEDVSCEALGGVPGDRHTVAVPIITFFLQLPPNIISSSVAVARPNRVQSTGNSLKNTKTFFVWRLTCRNLA